MTAGLDRIREISDADAEMGKTGTPYLRTNETRLLIQGFAPY
jgi:hypothetical protein